MDGHNPDAVKKAILAAQAVTDRPSLICCKTTIAYGAPTLAGSMNPTVHRWESKNLRPQK